MTILPWESVLLANDPYMKKYKQVKDMTNEELDKVCKANEGCIGCPLRKRTFDPGEGRITYFCVRHIIQAMNTVIDMETMKERV